MPASSDVKHFGVNSHIEVQLRKKKTVQSNWHGKYRPLPHLVNNTSKPEQTDVIPSPVSTVLAEHTWSETLPVMCWLCTVTYQFSIHMPAGSAWRANIPRALAYQHCVSVTVPPETPSQTLRLVPEIELESCSELEEKWRNCSSQRVFLQTFWAPSSGRLGYYQTSWNTKIISLHPQLSSFSLDALILSFISSLTLSVIFRLLSFCSQFDLLWSLLSTVLSFIFSLLSSLSPFIFSSPVSLLHFSSLLILFLSVERERKPRSAACVRAKSGRPRRRGGGHKKKNLLTHGGR